MEISSENQKFLDNQKYELYHIGIENQNAYRMNYEGFYFELVCHPTDKWSYHIERNNKMLFDSRISNKKFDSAEKAHNIMILKITDYTYKRRNN